MNPPVFWHPGLPYVVALDAAPYALILKHRQRGWFASESGGLLFAKLTPDRIIITEATGPQKKDRRSGSSFTLHTPSAQSIIDERFARGLHYVGEWHTHRERFPRPSDRDLKTMASVFAKSSHRFGALIFLVVGTSDGRRTFWCGAQTSTKVLQLAPKRT